MSDLIHKIRSRPEFLLLLMAGAVPLSFATWQALLNNFAIERAAFSGAEIGILQSLREVPGFLAFTVVFLLFLLREQQIARILNHAEDQIVFIDPDFLPIAEAIDSEASSVRQWVVLAEELPATSLENAVAYEELIAGSDPLQEWPLLDEWSAATLCYTSGTTGNPKGCLLYTSPSPRD